MFGEYGRKWGDGWESNPRHLEPQSSALPTELPPPLKPGLPDRDRTCNPQLRRLVLYPIELRADSRGHWSVLTTRSRHVHGRGGGIRTPDILLPKQARYRAALHPEGMRTIPARHAKINVIAAMAPSLKPWAIDGCPPVFRPGAGNSRRPAGLIAITTHFLPMSAAHSKLESHPQPEPRGHCANLCKPALPSIRRVGEPAPEYQAMTSQDRFCRRFAGTPQGGNEHG